MAELRHRLDRRVERRSPASAAISFIALSVARTKPATASCFAAIVAVDAMSPGPGSGVIVVDVEDERLRPGQLELDRLVVREARRRVDGALGDGRALAEVRVLDDRRRRRASGSAEASSAWSMIQDEPYLPGMPIFLPFEVGGVVDPATTPCANTIDGNWP